MPPALNLQTIVETCICGDDLAAMEEFYSKILNLPVIDREQDRHVFFVVGASQVLLVFKANTTLQGHHLPPHGTTGPGHVAFGVSQTMLDSWRQHLIQHGIAIEKEHNWPRGGQSIYFRDPAGNSIELITPGVWGTSSGW